MRHELNAVHLKTGSAALLVVAVSSLLVVCNPVENEARSAEVLSFEEGTGELASALLRGLKKVGIQTVAVEDLEDLGSEPRILGPFLARELSDRLTEMQDELRVVEREGLPELIEEQSFLGSGLLDSTTTAEPGRFRGAEAVIQGEVTVAEDSILVSTRASTVETAVRVASASVRLSRASVAERIFQPTDSQALLDVPSQEEVPTVLDTWEGNGLRVEALDLRRAPDRRSARVDLRFINLMETELLVGVQLEAFRVGVNYLYEDDAGDEGQEHRSLGDGRGPGIGLIGKTSNRTDYTILPPGETEVRMVYKANQGKLISGNHFNVGFRLVFYEEGEPARYNVSLGNLALDER